MLILDVVGPITHQAMQTNYHTSLTCVIQFDWCVRGATARTKIINLRLIISMTNISHKLYVHNKHDMLSNKTNIMKNTKVLLFINCIHEMFILQQTHIPCFVVFRFSNS